MKAAMQSELRPEDFVLPENQEKNADADAKKSQGASVVEREVQNGSGS
ncbi:MAG TPA: hypothetical protein VFN20_14130 [Candidatus Acidoferrum sp.]|nr:hypothetical protein [Candidatus Acidoferrum sp.]